MNGKKKLRYMGRRRKKDWRRREDLFGKGREVKEMGEKERKGKTENEEGRGKGKKRRKRSRKKGGR